MTTTGLGPREPLQCIDCGRAFTRKEHLDRHVRIREPLLPCYDDDTESIETPGKDPSTVASVVDAMLGGMST